MTHEGRQRVLLVTRNLPPLVGGMERLNWHIADELSRHADVHVIGPQGAGALKPDDVAMTEVPLRPVWRFLLANATQAAKVARRFKPNIVLAGSGLTAPAALLAARVSGAQAAAYVHGLDVAVQHPAYRALWHPAIRRMDVVIANSLPTANLVRALAVHEPAIRIVHPGVQLPAMPQPVSALLAFRERYGLGEGRVLLSVGRLTTRKGLREFVQYALPSIVKDIPDAILAVVGDAPADALRAGTQSRESIQAAADAAGVGNSLRFLGVITDPVLLACAYESASVHVFPVRSLPSDPEGFGMVAIEAAAHGLPTVAFATGGIVDAVAEGQSGYLIAAGDYAAMSAAVLRVLAAPADAWRSGVADFAKDFAWPQFGRRMADALAIGAS